MVFAGVYSAADASSTPFLLVTTDRGDVRELLDAAGDSFAYYEYDAYGNPMVTSTRQTSGESTVTAALAATIAERQVLRYASYSFDAHSGLYYCSQRYYDPRSAAFISKDPARADGEEGAYQYCAGEPVGKVDPSGLVPVTTVRHAIYTFKVGATNPSTFVLNMWARFYDGLEGAASSSLCGDGDCHGDGDEPNRLLWVRVLARRTKGPKRKVKLRVKYRCLEGNWHYLSQALGIEPPTTDTLYIDKKTSVLYNDARPDAARLWFGPDYAAYQLAGTLYY